ncbi:MAG: ATP-binding cassette domain-containing protein [Deltaproteobacteria bacterium]|nr:ATP-binding cassette domain-containing protein [Deltaproteobacteria bacterium]
MGRPRIGAQFGRAFRPEGHFDRSAAHKPILVLDGVVKVFRADAPVLRRVDLTIERGEFVFVTGPSGAGKSTLLKLVYRSETVDEGRVLFCGRDIARLTPESVPFLRRNIGVVFQDFKLVPYWSVFENVAVALEVAGMPGRVIRSRVALALERVGLAGRGEDLASVLSGGEQQRVAVARAIVNEPAIILADEPTGNLDPVLALDILGLFEEIHESGTTVLFATHDRALLEQSPQHRLIVIDDGRTIEARKGLRAMGGALAAQRAQRDVDDAVATARLPL